MIDLEPRAKYSEGAEVVLRSNSSIWIGRDRWAVIGRGSGSALPVGQWVVRVGSVLRVQQVRGSLVSPNPTGGKR